MGSVSARERQRAPQAGAWPLRQRNHHDFTGAAQLAVQISQELLLGSHGRCTPAVFPGHALLRTLRDDPTTRVHALDVLFAQPPGTKDRHLLH